MQDGNSNLAIGKKPISSCHVRYFLSGNSMSSASSGRVKEESGGVGMIGKSTKHLPKIPKGFTETVETDFEVKPLGEKMTFWIEG